MNALNVFKVIQMDDIVATIDTLLTDNRTASNTANVTPVIDPVYDKKRIDLRTTAVEGGDQILIYSFQRINSPNAIGATTKKFSDFATIDIRSRVSRAHSILLRDEVERILDTNIVNPSADYCEIKGNIISKELSNKSVKLYRFIFENLEFIQYNASR